MTKTLFLDIDGVLNSQLWFESDRFWELAKNSDQPHQLLCETAVGNLNWITEETGVFIVVSSLWRIDDDIYDILENNGVTGKVIGKTPYLYLSEGENTVPRGLEIQEFIRRNELIIGQSHWNYRAYAILDDDSDMLLKQYENYFRVDGYCGLTHNVAYRVINFLKSFDL